MNILLNISETIYYVSNNAWFKLYVIMLLTAFRHSSSLIFHHYRVYDGGKLQSDNILCLQINFDFHVNNK